MTLVQKKNKPRELVVSTPQSRKLKWMAQAGVIVPEEISIDDERVPLDFTRLSARGIGELHSRYAVRHAHAIFNAALLESDILRLKRELRIEQAKFRIRHEGLPKNLVDAMMEEDEEISGFLDQISQVEIKLTLMEAVVKTYEGIRNAASREIARRSEERAPLD